eukprot:5892493-Pleurochrysis_carterae.AAC.1
MELLLTMLAGSPPARLPSHLAPLPAPALLVALLLNLSLVHGEAPTSSLDASGYREDGIIHLSSTDDELATMLDRHVASSTVVIFGSSGCLTRTRVAEALEDLGMPYYSVDLDHHLEGHGLRKALAKRVGNIRTPAVFVRGQHVRNIGKALKTGELEHWVASEGI